MRILPPIAVLTAQSRALYWRQSSKAPIPYTTHCKGTGLRWPCLEACRLSASLAARRLLRCSLLSRAQLQITNFQMRLLETAYPCCCFFANALTNRLVNEHACVPVQDAVFPVPSQRCCRRLLSMSPTLTTSTAQARTRSRSATAVTMCQQGRQTNPRPRTHTVRSDPSLYSSSAGSKHAVLRYFCIAHGACTCCCQCYAC